MDALSITRSRISIACAIAILVACTTWSLALAQATPEAGSSGPEIAFYPIVGANGGAISVMLDPGESENVSVMLGNQGGSSFDAVTYAADAFTLRNGGFGVRELDGQPTGPTTWLDYPTEYFSTVPDEGFERQFSISVPDNTPPGEYVTGIVMQTAAPLNDDFDDDAGDYRLNLYYRSVIGISIVVPGDFNADLEFGSPYFETRAAIPGIIVPVVNVGNVQTSTFGEMQLRDSDGELIASSPLRLGAIYGSHETEIFIGLAEPLPTGNYKLSVQLEDSRTGGTWKLDSADFIVTESHADTGTELSPIRFTTSTAEPMPAADNVQFLAVDATITNTTEEPIANAQLSLIATVDGEEVERFPISQSLSVPPGDTDVSTRYIPLTGWTSGEWEFELLLETVEGSGAAVVVDRVTIETKVTIP